MANSFLQWMTINTKSKYWHDSAVMSEMDEALSNGAVGMTTNPFLCNATLQNNMPDWQNILKEFPKSLSGDEQAEALIKTVTLHYAEKLFPLYKKNSSNGLVCAQTSPVHISDAEQMMRQADRIAAWAPNISVKLPSTLAGLEVFEECVAKGYNVTSTVSFTVPQVMAFGAAQKRGAVRAKAAGIVPGTAIAVIMVGRLDDYIRDVSTDQRAGIAESDIINAGTACMKRVYTAFKKENYDTILMPAGCRGSHHVMNLAGGEMIMSIAPKIAEGLSKEKAPFEERINIPVSEKSINNLLKLKEFRKAYEFDGMKPEDFITYGAVNRTATQFIESGWNPLMALKI